MKIKALMTRSIYLFLLLVGFNMSCKTPGRALKIGSDVATITIKLHALPDSENRQNLLVSLSKCAEVASKSKITENDEVEFKVSSLDSKEYCIVEVTDSTTENDTKIEWIDKTGLKYRSNNVKISRNIDDKLFGNAILEKTYNIIASPSPSESFTILLNTVFPPETLDTDEVVTARISCTPEIPYSSKLEMTDKDEGLFRYSHEINNATKFNCTELKGFIDGEFSFEATLPANYQSFTVSPGDVVNYDSDKIEVQMINKEFVVSFDNDTPLECGPDEVFDRSVRTCIKK
jgi:hypothetical protein